MKRAFLLLGLLVASCRTELLPEGSGQDGGVTQVTFDLAMASCDELRQLVSSLLIGPQKCSSDNDCEAIGTACGLAGVCGAFVNQSTAAQVKSLVAEYDAEKCGAGQACPGCPAPPPGASCNHGLCGPPSN